MCDKIEYFLLGTQAYKNLAGNIRLTVIYPQ